MSWGQEEKIFMNKLINKYGFIKSKPSWLIYGLVKKLDMSLLINSYITKFLINWEFDHSYKLNVLDNMLNMDSMMYLY